MQLMLGVSLRARWDATLASYNASNDRGVTAGKMGRHSSIHNTHNISNVERYSLEQYRHISFEKMMPRSNGDYVGFSREFYTCDVCHWQERVM